MRLFRPFFAILLLVASLSVLSCEKPAPLPEEETIAVTYNTIDGCWQLTMWQGTAMADDTYLYIAFDGRKHRFEMWDNLNSMYATDKTGTFIITQEEDGTYTLSGSYDYGLGNWNSDYRVTLSREGNSMRWLSLSGNNDIMDFVRIEAIPELN